MNKLINMKKFVYVIVILTLVFVLYHTFIWINYTSKFFNLKDNYNIGDLGRMSYQIGSLDKRKFEVNLEKRCITKETYKNQKIDVITIGDSFSQGGGSGLNPYYQDYLATRYNLNILNIRGLKKYDQIFETILILLNNGTLEKIKPKVILIESVSRYATSRFSKEFDFNLNKSINIEDLIEKRKFKSDSQKLLFINTANYKYPYYSIKYLYEEHAHKSTYKFKLTNDLFSVKNKNHLLVYNEDINVIRSNNLKNITKINNNFNQLAKMLEKNNIKLIFMPTVDKYDLYYDYIENKTHPKNDFFTHLEPLKKSYYFVNTKEILARLVQKDIKDVYFADDTHWSYKASEAVSKDKIFDILKH